MKSALISLIFISSAFILECRNFRMWDIPNGLVNRCETCHTRENDMNTGLNLFGQDVYNALIDKGGNIDWDLIKEMDSDGDGFSNAVELQDLSMEWKPGSPSPGDTSLVTAPGNPDQFPSSVGGVLSSQYNLYYSNGLLQVGSSRYSASISQVKVYDIKGLLIAENTFSYGSDVLSFDMTMNKTGVYFIVIIDKKSKYYHRFIKN